MAKSLKYWTLKEIKEECGSKNCNQCILHNHTRGGCRILDLFRDYANPCNWDLDEKPRFTQQEIELAKIFAQDYPEGKIERADPNTLLFQESPEGTWNELPAKLFPSLGYAQTCKLSEIIEGDN